MSFGQNDPIFGLDISFHVFTVPAVTVIVSAIFSALILALIAVVATGVLASRAAIARGHGLRGRAIVERTTTVGFIYGGLDLHRGAVLEWFGRYGLLTGGDDTIAGAGRAAREVDIPARTVAALVLLLIGIGLLALARAGGPRAGPPAGARRGLRHGRRLDRHQRRARRRRLAVADPARDPGRCAGLRDDPRGRAGRRPRDVSRAVLVLARARPW